MSNDPPRGPGPRPSSSTEGFFQQAPVLTNQFYEDAALQRTLNFFVPPSAKKDITADLDRFGDLVLSQRIQQYLSSAEQHPPTLQTWDSFGKRADRLITSEGWRQLQALGIKEGIVAIAYDGRSQGNPRLHQFLKYHLWTPSSATVTCPSAMTDGAAALLSRHLCEGDSAGTSPSTRSVLKEAYSRLVSRDPDYAWTSGQWMTERAGGSDVSGTETRATLTPDQLPSAPLNATASDGSPLGPWRVDGFKWFSSATDADMSVLLAKTGDTDKVSLFFAPTRLRLPSATPDTPTLFNGIEPQRLKSKLGTRALPTAELVLRNMRAHMLGRPGHGTKEVSTVLNITRVHNAVSSMGFWGRGLAVSRAFARVRRTGPHLLADVPAHVRALATHTVAYRAHMLSTFFIVTLLGISEGAPRTAHISPTATPDPALAGPLLRLLTPVFKACTALAANAGLRAAIESLGGIGYLEDPADPLLNISRLFRDVTVLAIWEGTTDVMAADTVRVLLAAGGGALAALRAWVEGAVGAWDGQEERARRAVGALLDGVEGAVASAKGDAGGLLYAGREVVEKLARVVGIVLLVEDARRDGDVVAREIARRFLDAGEKNEGRGGWREEAAWDRRIVFESDEKRGSATAAKL